MTGTEKNGNEMPRIGLLDRALASVAPGFALRRFTARAKMASLSRSYDAASRGRGTDGWRASGSSADAEIGAAGAILRNRMRDLTRNNPMAAQAVQVLVNNIVGPGIRPRAKTGDDALNKKVDKLWDAWSAHCDAHGHTDFHGLTALAVREMVEGGDLFAVARPQRQTRKGDVPLKIELREADHLDASKFDSRPDGLRISQGIEYDANGKRSGYWMFPDHPGDNSPIFTRRLESVRIPAERVAHLFERQRVQSRGAPWGVPAMRAIRDVDDWQHAELTRKKTEACLVGVIFGDEDMDSGVTSPMIDAEGNAVEEWSPGLVAYARGGKDVKFNQPASVGGVYEWHRVQLHIIAAGFRVPYALMTGDLSQANFASSRVGLNEFRRMVDQIQWQTVIPMFCQPIWEWFVKMAQTNGDLPIGREIAVEWAPPRLESVNPLQDAQADLLETRSGFATPQQQIAKRGYDPDKVIEEWAEFVAKVDGKSLIFDSDPRKVTKVGQAHTSDPNALGASGDT
jgi:lambda family phage portal protein